MILSLQVRVVLLALIAGLINSISAPAYANVVSATCVIGSSSSCPAQSPQEIFNLYGTTTNQSYWLNVNGTATQTYLILDPTYPESGGWFLGMKGTKASTAFTYSANHWTSTTSLSPTSLTDDVSTDAKFEAFNYLPVTRIAAVYKDRDSFAFWASGSGEFGTNKFLGHTWVETITSSTMLNRFNSNSNVANGTGTWSRHGIYRESNSGTAKLVFPYQTGYYQYGFANTNGQSYRWGVTFNNEGNQGSNDSVSGIGLANHNSAGILSYADSLSLSVNGFSGNPNGVTQTLPSGFQIWGKMANGTLAAPASSSHLQQTTSSTLVSWSAVTNATEYLVQYKTTAQTWANSSTVRVTSPTSTPSANLTGLFNRNYDFRIWARGANNTYAVASSSLSVTMDQTSPTITGPSGANGATSTISIPETATAVHTFTASESVTWSKSGADGSFFSITSAGGVLTVSSRDFESPADVGSNNTYEVTITATDTVGNVNNQTLTVTITNVNEAPTITINSSNETHTITQAENISSVVTYTATDVDAGTTLSWSLSGTDAADFSINSSSGALAFAANPDFEAPADSDTNNVYTVVITVSDGVLSDTQTLTVSITNASESASINAPTVSGTINKGVVTTITVTINVAGKVRFFVGGKRISTCKDRTTSGTYPNNTATCSWRPAVTGRQILTATLTPTDSTFSASTSAPTTVQVVRRGTTR